MSGQANWRFGADDPLDETADLSARAGCIGRQLRDDWERELNQRARVRRARKIDIGLQIGLALFTLSAIWLITGATEYARWGHVAGLASQPFYIAASWRARQWGMFVVAVALCGLWLRGISNSF